MIDEHVLRWFGIAGLAAACFAASSARAEPERGSTVSALTMGPGDATFSKFGHDAIAVTPPRGATRVYNFGTFELDDPHLVGHFLHKDLHYWLSVSLLEATITDYSEQNRSVVEQELALTQLQARALARALAENARPENRFYAYDYFRDNCSTRVRDALDRVLDGALRRAARPTAALSYRDHALRLASDDLPLFVGLDFGLSGYADRHVGEWDELFLPEKLEALLRRVRVPDSNGGSMPLVRSEHVLFRAKRAPLPDAPPRRTAAFFGAGSALAGMLSALSGARARVPARLAFGVLVTLYGSVLGAFGALLGYFWLFTAHRAAWANLNLLFAPPWLVACAVAGPAVALGKPWGSRLLSLLALATALSSLIAVTLLPVVAQHSERIAALLAPSWIALAGIEIRARARRR